MHQNALKDGFVFRIINLNRDKKYKSDNVLDTHIAYKQLEDRNLSIFLSFLFYFFLLMMLNEFILYVFVPHIELNFLFMFIQTHCAGFFSFHFICSIVIFTVLLDDFFSFVSLQEKRDSHLTFHLFSI